MRLLRVLSFGLLLVTWSAWGGSDLKAFDLGVCDDMCSELECCLVSINPAWDTCDEYCQICVEKSGTESGACWAGELGWGVSCRCEAPG